MSLSPRWLVLPLLLLALSLAAPSSATPEPPSAATFLATLSDTPPCLAENQSQASLPAPEIALQVPAPEARVIYPDCGVFCSDHYCSGLRTLDQCTNGTGAAGFCKAVNQVCSGEPLHSPCTCTTF